MGTIVLLDLMGGVALLLWGLHIVHSGILRAFGPDVRRVLHEPPIVSRHRQSSFSLSHHFLLLFFTQQPRTHRGYAY
jgi:hypothetical protein